MTNTKVTLLAGAALCAAALAPASASALPAGGLAKAASELSDVQQVRWVCGPFRCWWRPGYGYYGAYAWGAPYGRPWWGGHFYGRPWWGGHFYHRRWDWGW
jgi:hypothetical protein